MELGDADLKTLCRQQAKWTESKLRSLYGSLFRGTAAGALGGAPGGELVEVWFGRLKQGIVVATCCVGYSCHMLSESQVHATSA